MTETTQDNLMPNIVDSGDEKEVQMILGDSERIRYAGAIRPGAKTPKRGCSPDEKGIFTQLESEGHTYDYIDKQMGGEPRTSRTKLIPINTDHFVIRAADFKNPNDASFILDNFADPDGKVRRIPIWFPTGSIDTSIPHNFRAFGGSNLKAVSLYNDQDRLCFKYIPKGKTEFLETDEDDPDKITKLCGAQVKFGGIFKFYVKGLRTLNEIILPTTSWYGLGDAVAMLKRVRSVFGRFHGLYQGTTFLELVKVKEMVKDPKGKKQVQWLVTIELAQNVDPMELCNHNEASVVRGMSSLRSACAVSSVDSEPEPDTSSDVPDETAAEPTGLSVNEIKNKIKGLAEENKIPLGHMYTYCSTKAGGTIFAKIKDLPTLEEIHKSIVDGLEFDTKAFSDHCRDLFSNSQD